MRHLTAARKGTDGGWHYVSLGRDGGHPIGNCAQHEPHATEAEARECYSAYQRDNVRLDSRCADWRGCDVCDAPTKTTARIWGDGFHVVPLCAEHLDYDHAVRALHLDGLAGDAWHS